MRQRSHGPGNSVEKPGYLSEQTIAALATAVGGAISIIRISGPRAFEALTVLSDKDTFVRAENRRMTRALLRAPSGEPLAGELLDDAVVVKFQNPESFTGEDVVELHIHGGGFTATRILEILAARGVRQALPGEFSFRAVKNGKMTLSQAQAVADLIAASNTGAVSLALEKMSGSQNLLLGVLAADLRKLAALGEIGIDFADQDVDEVSLPVLKKRIAKLVESLETLKSSFDRGHKLQDGIGVAFVGLPNAGKSSFFNALLGEDRSIVSETAGTTRDVIREKITLGSVTLRMEDTAGLRKSSDTVEKIGIARSRASAKAAEVVLFLVDPGAQVAPVLEEWKELSRIVGGSLAGKTLGIFTKCDLSSDSILAAQERLYSQTGIAAWVQTSAITGQGIHAAAEKIALHCSALVSRNPGEVLLTRLDQVNSVKTAIEHLVRAQSAPEIELFASDIRQALHSLGLLIGETLPDDILGQIFSEFCIGK